MTYKYTLTGKNFQDDGQLKSLDWNQVDSPVYWFRNDPLLSYLGGIYIVVMGEIEEFTVLSMKGIAQDLPTKDLLSKIERLIHEEKKHASVHSQVINHLTKNNFPSNPILKYTRLFFKFNKRLLGKKSAFALVLAMAFYAHELANAALKYNFFPKNKSEIFDFLRWHCVEKLSHTKRCFEIYNQSGGGYIRRILMQLWFSLYVLSVLIIFLPACYFKSFKKGLRFEIKKFFKTLSLILGFRGYVWSHLRSFLRYFNPTITAENIFAAPSQKKILERTRRLPYFDMMIRELSAGNENLRASFGKHVHWGYWQNFYIDNVSDEEYTHAASAMVSKIAELARIENNQAVLDVGCGFGGTLSQINDCYRDMNLMGVNIDERQIDRARKINRPAPSNRLQFIVADACALPVSFEKFDRILAVECIFHFSSRERFFKEASRILKPGGTITITDFVPHPLYFFNSWLLSTRLFSLFSYFGYHNTTYTLKSYKRLAEKFNFKMRVEDISHNTLPTYEYLNHLADKLNTNPFFKACSKWNWSIMSFLTQTKLLTYKIMTFENQDL